MICSNCKFLSKNSKLNELEKNGICKITNICNPKACTYIKTDNDVSDMNICFNCQNWIGGGDWGLSCKKDYYNCNTNGFKEACSHFIKKQKSI